MAIDGTMATRAVTPAGLAAPSAGRARSSRARNLAIPDATSATATRREVSQQVTYRVDIPIMALSRLDAREASMRYRDDLMAGREESMEESTAVKVIASAEEESESKKEETPEVESEPKVDRWASLMDPRGQADPISAANIGLDPRAGGAPVDGAEGGAGRPVGASTWKPESIKALQAALEANRAHHRKVEALQYELDEQERTLSDDVRKKMAALREEVSYIF